MNWLQELEVEGAELALTYVQANADEIEDDLKPYIQDGEQGIEKWADAKSPLLGAAVRLAIKELGSDVPKLEDSGVKWIEDTLKAFIAKVKGS